MPGLHHHHQSIKKNASSYSGPTGSIPISSLAFSLLWSQLLHAAFILREISQLRRICQALWHLYVQTLSKHGKKRIPQKQLCGAENFPIWFFSWRRMATWQLFQHYTRSRFYVHRQKKLSEADSTILTLEVNSLRRHYFHEKWKYLIEQLTYLHYLSS